jgi:hypothetical protein
MSLQSLARALIRDTSLLVASVATRDGSRMPVAPLLDRLFHGLACELHGRQVRRRVAADMFGMAPRAYLRKVRRAEESVTDHGYSLWQGVYEHIAANPGIELAGLARRFHRDDEGVLRGVLSDLRESGLVEQNPANGFCAASGRQLSERLARKLGGNDELVWAVIYREGPLYREALQQVVGLADAELDEILLRLKEAGRVFERPKRDRIVLSSAATVPDLDAPERWEADVFAHYHAVVRALSAAVTAPADDASVATFSFDLGPTHPMAAEVEREFYRVRGEIGELAKRVAAFNAQQPQKRTERVALYLGLADDRPRNFESPSTMTPAELAGQDNVEE